MKTISYLLLSAFFLAFVSGCSKDDNDNSPDFRLKDSDNIDELDYRLYSLVLDELFPNADNLVVQQEVRSGSAFPHHAEMQAMKQQHPELDTAVFWDPVILKDSVYFLENRFSLAPKTVSLITDEEIQYIFSNSDINAGWEEFFRRYPNSSGTISFSRIAYNTDKTQAMVNMGNMYASLGGEGRLIFLELDNDGWKILLSMLTWIS